MFTLDNLSSVEFEEYCYDLLVSLNYTNLSWRKGTGLESSPSDQGRDITASQIIKEIDLNTYEEKWFIECKHYKKGVPPEKLQSALAWANAERPNVLLFIVSNALSNPSKAFIENYISNNHPPFRIKVWEKKDLETLTMEQSYLKKKYKLEPGLPFVDIANKYHLIYALQPQMNTLEYFFELLEQLDSDKRDKAFGSIFYDVINPRYREAKTGNETLGQLRIDKVDYHSFRTKCIELNNHHYQVLFVHHIVTGALSWMLSMGNITEIADKIKNFKGMLDMIEKRNLPTHMLSKNNEHMVSMLRERIANIERETKENYELYNDICELVVRKLLVEDSNKTLGSNVKS